MLATDSFCLLSCRQEGLVPIDGGYPQDHCLVHVCEFMWCCLNWNLKDSPNFFSRYVSHLEAFNEGIVLCTCHSKVLMPYMLACSIVSILLEAQWKFDNL